MKTLFYAFLTAFLIFSQLPVFGQSISWQQLSGPDGGAGFVYAGKNGYLFSILPDNVLYRSADGGLNWQKMPQTPANIWYWPLSVGYDGNLYAGKSSDLYRSVNDGQSWVKLNFNLGSVKAATGLPGNVMLVGNDGKIHRSANEGQSWTTINLDLGEIFDHFAYNPTTDHVYTWSTYGQSGKIFRSSDKGLTWKVFFNMAGQEPNCIAFTSNGSLLVGAKSTVWRTSDDGATWTQHHPFPQNSSSDVQLVATASGRVFAQEWYKSFYSDDNGNTWKEYVDPEGNYLELFSALPDGQLFAIRSSGSLRRSTDNGSTWSFAARGMKGAVVVDIAFPDDDKILAATYDGLFYSANNGSTWELLYDKVNMESYPTPLLEITPTGEWYLYDGTNIVRFRDEGKQIQILSNPLGPNHEPDDFQIHPQTGTLFLLDWSSIFRSTDAGVTWQEIEQRSSDLLFMPDGSMLSAGFEGLARSGDDGLTWQFISNFQAYNISIDLSGNLYNLGVSNGTNTDIWRSIDGGGTWDSISSNLAFVQYKLSVNSAGHLFVVDEFDSKLMRSVDGGFTFNFAASLPVEYAYNNQLRFGPDQRLYLLSEGHGIYRSTSPTTNVTLMQGSVFTDLDGNCTFAAPDTLSKGWPVKAVRGSETVYGFAGSTGKYIVPVNTGNYELSVVTPNDYWRTCKTTITAVAGGGTIQEVNVGVQALVECPYMEVDIAAPFLRRCFESQITVSYCNKGTAKAEDAYIEVTLDSLLIFNSATIPVVNQSGHIYRFNLGDVAVGQCGNFRILCTPSCNAALGEIHCIEAHIYPDQPCPELPRPQVRTSAVCTGDSVRLTIQNIGTVAMSTPRNWQAIDPDDYQPPFAPLASGNVQLGAGQSFTKSVPVAPRIQFFAEQDPLYPYNVVSQTEVRNCGASSGSAPFSIVSADEEGPFIDVICQPNQGSFDPNDKTGFPSGIADKHYIAREQDLEYLIRFQNTGTDTAFNITVRDTLPVALLDPASVRPGASSHPYTFSISPKGVLLFMFQNILLPDSNINEAASHGFVQFRVAQQPNTPTGSSIYGRAAIYFDFNDPVLTNTTLHTVGIPALVSTHNVAATAKTTVEVSPNPVLQQATLTLQGEVPEGDLLVEVYDATNRQVWSQSFRGDSTVLECGNLPSGIYNVTIKTGNGAVVNTVRVVVQ